jgi:hypothetical protein
VIQPEQTLNSLKFQQQQQQQQQQQTSESTNIKVQHNIFKIGKTVMCTMNSNYRIAATLYSPEAWFFFTNISVNTHHKRDDDDDDDDT